MIAELYKYASQLVLGAGPIAMRGDNTGALITVDAHGRYYEQGRQGNTWTLSTAVAGVTIAAANVYTAAAAQPLVGVYNPLGSGINVVVTRGIHSWNSGTPGTGGLVWASGQVAAAITAAGGNGAVNTLTSALGGSKVKTFVNAALTGAAASALQLVRYAGGPAAIAIAAGALTFTDEPAGEIIIAPGCAGGLFAAAAGTSPIVNASMVWEEVTTAGN